TNKANSCSNRDERNHCREITQLFVANERERDQRNDDEEQRTPFTSRAPKKRRERQREPARQRLHIPERRLIFHTRCEIRSDECEMRELPHAAERRTPNEPVVNADSERDRSDDSRDHPVEDRRPRLSIGCL